VAGVRGSSIIAAKRHDPSSSVGQYPPDSRALGTMQVKVALKKVSCGTELNITQEGLPDVIPTEACYLGWQESLALLAKLVEAEIPDGA
jgi:hypothetical protein